jgi:F-type H+-transporting ATPase subunit a
MSSPVLHIKDAYFFEVPLVLWPAHYHGKAEFPDVWVKLDPDFQMWEAERLQKSLAQKINDTPGWTKLREEYTEWREAHGNFGKPLKVMLDEAYAAAQTQFGEWKKQSPANAQQPCTTWLEKAQPEHAWFLRHANNPAFQREWFNLKRRAGDVAAYKSQSDEWSADKIAGYNKHLSGKVLIPQIPGVGELRNLHERDWGFCISKFMVIEFVVALLLLLVFARIGRQAKAGGAPRGRWWNLLEVFLVYIRDRVARPAIGHSEGDKFVPLLWTIFMFILSCNLCGMLPWVGAPTSSFGVTTGLALVTFSTGLACGMKQFGPLGFLANQIPHMHLPFPMGLIIKPMLLAIELLGLCIKHGVLAVRLLANMVAGHMVLVGIMGLAFGASAALSFASGPDWKWGLMAVIAVIASTLFSCLELFVAFLQAYVFTFLSALFIGASIHHH